MSDRASRVATSAASAGSLKSKAEYARPTATSAEFFISIRMSTARSSSVSAMWSASGGWGWGGGLAAAGVGWAGSSGPWEGSMWLWERMVLGWGLIAEWVGGGVR